MSIEAMKLALEALRKAHPISNSDKDLYKHSDALTALLQAIAEVEKQEPEKEVTITCSCGDEFYIPLDELIKRSWVGLTQDELNMIGNRMWTWNSHSLVDVYTAIEAKLKEKNT